MMMQHLLQHRTWKWIGTGLVLIVLCLWCIGMIVNAETVSDQGTMAEPPDVSTGTTLMPPSDLAGKKMKESQVKLTWTKVKGANQYTVYRSTKPAVGFQKLGTTKKAEYTDTSVKSGKVYYYKVTAGKKHKKALTSEASEYISIYMKPSAPIVKGQYEKKKIKIWWKKVRGASVYYVYRKKANGKYKLLGKTNLLYYKDADVKKGKSYTYRVVAAYKKNGKEVKSKAGKSCEVLAAAIDPNKKMIALTFDDGPGKYTEDIVKCLKDNNARATFFVLGCNIDSYKNAVKAADKIGCEIGNHTYNHRDLTKLSEMEMASQIDETDEKLMKLIGKKAGLLRTPGGAVNTQVENKVGKPIILWSIDTRDWEHRNRNKTINMVMNQIKDGDIVLMHDIYEPTKDAACSLIVTLKKQGYQLVTVSELAQYRKYELQKGKIYYSFRKKAK